MKTPTCLPCGRGYTDSNEYSNSRFAACRSVLRRVRQTHAVTAGGGDVHRLTQRRPHRLRRQTTVEGVLGGEAAEATQNKIAHQGAALDITKLLAHGDEELASGHALGALGQVCVEVAVELVRQSVGNTRHGGQLLEYRETLAHLDQNQ